MPFAYFVSFFVMSTLATNKIDVTGASGSCSPHFKICAPQGVKTDSLGPISPTWGDLFNNIVAIVSNYGISHSVLSADTNEPVSILPREQALCCSDVADCLLVPEIDIAMCWDRFTTNVFFADGTYGTVVTGDFNTSDGASVNLVYGDYTMKNGTKGNIYAGPNESSKQPDTSTMPIPSQWTSSGQGSAIPATGLGTTASLSTGKTIIPATTIPPSTAPSITIIATMTGCNHCPAYNTTIAGPTESGGTRPATTSTFTTGIITPTIYGSAGNPLSAELVTMSPSLVIIVLSIYAMIFAI